MAETNKLVIKFKDAADDNKSVTFSNAKKTATDEDVKALADGLITNGEIFSAKPVSKVSAQLITTTAKDFDIED